MARSRVVKFGPGSLESLELRQWLRPRTHGAILVSEVRGTFTVYCGAGNSHTVEISERLETHTASHLARDDDGGTTALRARSGDDDAADELARVLVDWALEDWADPCSEDEPDTESSVSRQHYIDTGEYLTYAETAELESDV